MLRGMKVFCRVLVGRIIATADVTAAAADPQMQPYAAALQAFLATERARRDVAGAGEQKQIADVDGALFTGQPAAPAHALERPIVAAFKRGHLGVEYRFDIRRGLDALDQVARHAGAKAAAADHHVNLAGVARQKHRGLAGGIAAAHQHDLLLRAQPRLDWRGPVPDAAALELLQVFDLGPPVTRAARDHDAARAQSVAALERERKDAAGARAIQRLRPDRNHDVGAAVLRLGEGAAGQRLARDSRGEAKVIFDSGAGAGLSAGRARVQHGHRETFRGPRHRPPRTPRTAAADRALAGLAPGGTADQPSPPGELAVAGLASHVA